MNFGNDNKNPQHTSMFIQGDRYCIYDLVDV
jgi:hypothetical protein